MIIKTGLISRIAFSIGNINIYWYAIIIVIGMLIGIGILKFRKINYGIKYEDILDLCLFVLPISIICARIYYVLFSLDYYMLKPNEILNIRDGGVAIYGGIIGSIITIVIYSKIKKIKVLDLLDFVAPSLAIGQSIGRWGNYINVEAYGSETNLPLRMEIIQNGITKYVHPTFLYESIVTFLLFIILMICSKKRKFSGEITYLYIIVYSFARMFIEYLRTDSLMLYNFKISLILSVLFFVIFTFILIFKIIKNKRC